MVTQYDPIDLCNILAYLASAGYNLVSQIELGNAFITLQIVGDSGHFYLSFDTHLIKFTHVENLQLSVRDTEGNVLENTVFSAWIKSQADHSN